MAQRVRIPHRGRKVLRLPHNSPFWQHFTQGFLLCSLSIIHEKGRIVNRFLKIYLNEKNEPVLLDRLI